MSVAPMTGVETKLPNVDIRLENVRFNYNTDGESAIRDISPDIKAGTITALVEPSGN